MAHNKDKKQNTPKSLPANGADDGNQIERVPAQLQEFIDVIPADKKQDFLNALVSVERSSSFAGPLPHPELYAGYEKVLPGSANRILSMAEKQLDYDFQVRQMEQHNNSDIIKGVNSAQKRGQYLGFIIVLLVAGLAAALSYFGYEKIGIAFVVSMASVAAVFALRKWPKEKNNDTLN